MISILIIGNEILSHQVQDTNLKHMLEHFSKRGIPVDEARIIRDHIDLISEAIRELSARSRYVISTGGLGPTHDDVTLKAYARAYNVPMVLHPELDQRLKDYFGERYNEATRQMAVIPENTELVFSGQLSWPIIKVANCYVLPGLPEIFERKFVGVLEDLPPVPDYFRADIYTTNDENSFAEMLSRIQEQYPEVEIGSYPTFQHPEYSAHLTFKGDNRASLNEAHKEMETLFRERNTLVRSIVPFKTN